MPPPKPKIPSNTQPQVQTIPSQPKQTQTTYQPNPIGANRKPSTQAFGATNNSINPYIKVWFSLCKRLTKVKSRWTSTHGMATAIYSSGTQLCNIGHTFICVIEAQRPTVKRPRNVSGTRPGHYNIVKIFKSTRKGEVINV